MFAQVRAKTVGDVFLRHSVVFKTYFILTDYVSSR